MGYDLASLRKIQRSNSHLSERRYCLEEEEDVEREGERGERERRRREGAS